MARLRRDMDLGTREARRRLPSRPEPYFLILERGLSLGYRKSAEGGAWMVRRFSERLRRHFEKRIATADDLREADGVEVMTFAQAQRRALMDATDEAEHAIGLHYTVADAVRGRCTQRCELPHHLEIHWYKSDQSRSPVHPHT